MTQYNAQKKPAAAGELGVNITKVMVA